MFTTKKIIISVIAIILVVIGIFSFTKLKKSQSSPSYETIVVERTNLINTVTASGNITTGNNLTISTNVSGTVSKLYVKNGDKVYKGQKIAEITPDQDSAQRQASAYSSYLTAKNSVTNAEIALHTLQSKEFAANQVFMKGAVANNDSTSDPTYIQQNADWLAAEANYKNQVNVIAQTKASLNSAWLSYQQYSPIITAPQAGIVKNLTIAPGSVLTSTQNSSSNTTTSQKLATISKENDQPQASVSLSEIDAIKVKPDQQVTLTLDAYADKTFTGKVLVVDTNGSVSSGVTTYPATIVFDTSIADIYPNMAVAATIVTNLKSDVLVVPTTAITTQDGLSTVQLMKDNKPVITTVELGIQNDNQTEIISGLSEGDIVITSTISNSSASNANTTTSPFSGFGTNTNSRNSTGGNRIIMQGGPPGGF